MTETRAPPPQRLCEYSGGGGGGGGRKTPEGSVHGRGETRAHAGMED